MQLATTDAAEECGERAPVARPSQRSSSALTRSGASFWTKWPASSIVTTVGTLPSASVRRKRSGETSSLPRNRSSTPQSTSVGAATLGTGRRRPGRIVRRNAARYQSIAAFARPGRANAVR